MFNEHLQNIKKDLSKHHRKKHDLNMMYVQQRLNKSLTSYYSDLNKSVSYLQNRNPYNVIKRY